MRHFDRAMLKMLITSFTIIDTKSLEFTSPHPSS